MRRTLCSALAVTVASAVTAGASGAAGISGGSAVPAVTMAATTDGGTTAPGTNTGPPYNFTTELKGQFGTPPLKNQAMLTRTKLGYRLWSGQQDNRLILTRVDRGLRFVDRGTDRFKKLAPACQRKRVKVGIAAVCRVPGDVTVRRPLLIEVWPRLGNDFTDSSALPATFAVTMLGDKGRDVAHFGAGPDFFNGFSGHDHVWGGAGNDWIRPGDESDAVRAGAGSDDVVSVGGADVLRGQRGHDQLWGGDGNDRIRGQAGADFLLCGNGRDRFGADGSDRVAQSCEVRS